MATFDVEAFRKRVSAHGRKAEIEKEAFYAWVEEKAFVCIMTRLRLVDAFSGETGFELDTKFRDLVDDDRFVFQPYASAGIREKLMEMGFTGITIKLEYDPADMWFSVQYRVQ